MLLYIFNHDARFIFFNISAIEMTLFRSNKETLAWAKGIKWRDMTQENLTKEAYSFFGVVKTTGLQTVQSKIAEFVKREHSMRQTLSFR